eukprot:CAMPEP_0172602648 /NCGR_PEP_ID=MMETSP1068-20121228/22823_1 /TAXON_ID=35684 /ORGANISM="Pseudopedinella elastica, Strain CCMP716" /LENGTH=92 /DNA_ID=CAMNT_0013404075 /DNA_START=611 /DNA_END=885 /DNA_ORIENTATION=+
MSLECKESEGAPPVFEPDDAEASASVADNDGAGDAGADDAGDAGTGDAAFEKFRKGGKHRFIPPNTRDLIARNPISAKLRKTTNSSFFDCCG